MTIANLLFAFKYLDHIYNWYEYLLVGSLVLSAIMLYLIFFIKVFEIKKHIIVVILQALSVVTSYLSFGLFAHISPFGKQNIVFGIFGYLFALIGMLVLLNPRLRKWPIMIKFAARWNGTYLRPRFFMLALYEWGLLPHSFINDCNVRLSLCLSRKKKIIKKTHFVVNFYTLADLLSERYARADIRTVWTRPSTSTL